MDDWKKDFVNGYNFEAPTYEEEEEPADAEKGGGLPVQDSRAKANRSRIQSAKPLLSSSMKSSG